MVGPGDGPHGLLGLGVGIHKMGFLLDEAGPGTVGVWNFDEPSGSAAVDGTGSYPGQASGTQIVPGRFGLAREFDGNTDLVEIPGTGGLNFSTGGFTLEAWFKTSTARGGDSALVGKYDWSNRGNNGYFLSVTPNVGHVSFFVDRDPRLISSASYLDGRWHHCAATFDGEAVDAAKAAGATDFAARSFVDQRVARRLKLPG